MKELKEDKKQLEETISKMLSDFQKKYKVQVQEVDLIMNSYRTTDNYLAIGDIKAFIKIVFVITIKLFCSSNC